MFTIRHFILYITYITNMPHGKTVVKKLKFPIMRASLWEKKKKMDPSKFPEPIVKILWGLFEISYSEPISTHHINTISFYSSNERILRPHKDNNHHEITNDFHNVATRAARHASNNTIEMSLKRWMWSVFGSSWNFKYLYK